MTCGYGINCPISIQAKKNVLSGYKQTVLRMAGMVASRLEFEYGRNQRGDENCDEVWLTTAKDILIVTIVSVKEIDVDTNSFVFLHTEFGSAERCKPM